jgi:hypothetical protein
MKTIEIKLFSFDELSEESQRKAIEEQGYFNYENNDFSEWVIDDCYLLEPEQKELEKLYKKNNLIYKDLLIKNNRKIYFCLGRNRYLDISKGIEIQDDKLFLYWLGLTESLIKKISFEIGEDEIFFYEEIETTKIENIKLEKAKEKFSNYCEDILNSIQKSINYYFEDEYIIEELKNNNQLFLDTGILY